MITEQDWEEHENNNIKITLERSDKDLPQDARVGIYYATGWDEKLVKSYIIDTINDLIKANENIKDTAIVKYHEEQDKCRVLITLMVYTTPTTKPE